MKERKIMKKPAIMLMTVALTMLSCNKNAEGIEVSWKLISNQYQGRGVHKSEITFTNNSRHTLKNDNWTYYYSSFRTIVRDQESDIVAGETINGDLSRLYPTEKFPKLRPGESISFPLISTHYAMHFTDAPTGGFFVIKGLMGKELILNTGDATVLPFPKDEAYRRSAADKIGIETAADRYAMNNDLYILDEQELPPVFPTPISWEIRPDLLSLQKDLELYYSENLSNEAAYLQEKLQDLLGVSVPKFKYRSADFKNYKPARIVLEQKAGDPEHYTLEVDVQKGIRIAGTDPAGVFYGIQSLLSLLPAKDGNAIPETLNIPALTISDGPRFGYRGMHLDVARSFHKKEYIFRFLDRLAELKMNRLHFHITDDEGWRVEIPGLPELTEIGAFRGYTKDEKDHLQPALGSGPYADVNIGAGSGYYTRNDYIEILRYAKSRHIDVIPEIDMPGHIRSAVKAMELRYDRYMKDGDREAAEQYLLTDFGDTSTYSSAQRFKDNTANPCMESTYRFVGKVVEELAAMYREASAPLYILHIGGDEVPRGAFEHSPVCRAFLESQDVYKSVSELHKYFTKRVTAILKKYDIHTAGWEEVACKEENGLQAPDPSLVDEGIVTYIWNNVWGWGAEDLGYRIANTGFPIVMINATNFYFDFAYTRHPDEPGLYWGGYTDTRSAWEFTPFDITKCADKNIYGEPLSPEFMQNKVRLNEDAKKNILGLSGTLWAENLRTWERVEFMALPKMLGLAERAWSPQPQWAQMDDAEKRLPEREKEWNRFVNKVGRHMLPRLDAEKVHYRIPPPGAVIEGSLLKANVRFPGLILRYTLDGSEPDANSAVYTEPVGVRQGQTVKIASFNSKGRSSRVVTLSDR
ncbi:MAG: family 20 glycosylhydrolase [Candidatus Marinimicrobia bacterium]|nr:family 20 glycosylhydrolase [Candidatus Neomarinimicrobiota bacterium]